MGGKERGKKKEIVSLEEFSGYLEKV